MSLFSGIGAFEKALQRQNINYELVNYCEIDKYASKAYSLIHNVDEKLNLGDITKVDETQLKDFDLMTWGFPCQDISIAGKQKGIIKGETRSGLYYDGLRILEAKKPKYSIIENVKALTQKKFELQFKQILKDLNELGYNSYWKVLNAKDYGVPQNRERVFIVSIRKDVDNGIFEFPQGFDNGIRLKDILEKNVNIKYYLKSTKDFFIKNSFDMEAKGNGFRFEPHIKNNASIAKTITTRAGARMDDNFILDLDIEGEKFKFDSTNKLIQIGYIGNKNSQGNRVYDVNGLACTQVGEAGGLGAKTGLYTNGDNLKEGFVERKYNEFISKNGYIPEMFNPYNKTEIKDVAPTQTTQAGSTTSSATVLINTDYNIRKLTPLECFRLMGFDDEDFYILKNNGISDTQLYKMAGNSIVVNVLEYILKNLLLNNIKSNDVINL